MWSCQECSEMHEDSFDVCWNCGTSREGVRDPTFPCVDDKQGGQEPKASPSQESKRSAVACPVCNKPMVAGHVSLWGKEDARLDWVPGSQESDDDPSATVRLLSPGIFFGADRIAHRCVSCGVVTIECEVFRCGICGRIASAATKACTCDWSRDAREGRAN